MPFSRKSTVEYWKSYAILNAQYIDAMQGMNTLKVFHDELIHKNGVYRRLVEAQAARGGEKL